MKRFLLLFIIFIIINSVSAQTKDTLILKEVQINSTRISVKEEQMLRPFQIIEKSIITNAYDNDISTTVKVFSAVDIRQRSFSKAQSDINIRGGSFDQSLVLINGINLTDPQTGHYNLNIPINNSDLYGIEVVYGPGSRIFGANAFSGAINFISRVPERNELALDISYGSFNTLSANISAGLVLKNFKQSISIDYSQSDGFMHNTDYNKFNLYYENNFNLGILKGKTMIGFLDKKYGAYGFYSPQYIDQYESIKTGFAALKILGGNNLKWEYKTYYRVHKDRYELFREGDGFYSHTGNLWINSSTDDTITWYSGHNNHITSVAGSGFNMEKDWFLGKTALGLDYRYEHIYSNTLGEILEKPYKDIYLRSDNRNNFSLFVEHGYYTDRLIVNIGTLAYWNKKYSWNFYYGGDIGYKLGEKFIVKVGANRAMRLPTFTDLYYVGPANVGNPDLIPESAMSFDVGGKYYFSDNSYFNVSIFERLGKNIISWVRDFDAAVWESKNLTKLNTIGVEITSGYKDFPKDFFINALNIAYTYLYQDKSASGLESKYTLDHLKHRFVFSLNHKIYRNISALWSVNIFRRNGEFDFFDYDQMIYTGSVKYKTNVLLNLKVNADFDKCTIYVGGYNLTNSDYFDIGNIPTPGISFMLGLKYKII